MCKTLNIKALELYCNIKKWNIELDTLVNASNRKGIECSIKVGNTVLDSQQQRHLLAAVIQFDKIQDKYQLAPMVFEYSETVQFLRNCKELFYQKEYEEDDTI